MIALIENLLLALTYPQVDRVIDIIEKLLEAGGKAVSALWTGLSTLRIGSLVGPFYVGGHIAAIRYFRKRLPNAKLQSLTAP